MMHTSLHKRISLQSRLTNSRAYFASQEMQTSGSHSKLARKQEHFLVPQAFPDLAHVHPFQRRRPMVVRFSVKQYVSTYMLFRIHISCDSEPYSSSRHMPTGHHMARYACTAAVYRAIIMVVVRYEILAYGVNIFVDSSVVD